MHAGGKETSNQVSMFVLGHYVKKVYVHLDCHLPPLPSSDNNTHFYVERSGGKKICRAWVFANFAQCMKVHRNHFLVLQMLLRQVVRSFEYWYGHVGRLYICFPPLHKRHDLGREIVNYTSGMQ